MCISRMWAFRNDRTYTLRAQHRIAVRRVNRINSRSNLINYYVDVVRSVRVDCSLKKLPELVF